VERATSDPVTSTPVILFSIITVSRWVVLGWYYLRLRLGGYRPVPLKADLTVVGLFCIRRPVTYYRRYQSPR